jgi:hypothetical protein
MTSGTFPVLWLAPILALAAGSVGTRDSLTVHSPSNGAHVRSPWVPVRVALPYGYERPQVQVHLDAELVTDPVGVIRRRVKRHGDGWDYLATLDLTSVEPGAHQLEFSFTAPGRPTVRGTTMFEVDRPEHRVRVTAMDERGRPTSARVVIVHDEALVNLASPDAAQADPSGRDTLVHSLFVIDGQGTVDLDAGSYRLIAVRGIRDHLAVEEVELNEDTVVDLRIRRAVPTPGRLAADLHVHTARSADAFIPDQVRYWSLLAADLDVFVATDHNRVTTPAFVESLLSIAPENLTGVPGVEARIGVADEEGERILTSIGHINAFPVLPETDAPLPNDLPVSVGAYLDGFRQRQQKAPYPGAGEGLVLQLSHPRGIQFFPDKKPIRRAHALFNRKGYTRALPVDHEENAWLTEPVPETGTTALDFDAIEVLNRFSIKSYKSVRQDWFALLSQGHILTGTGNSDSHAVEIERVGFPINLISCPPPSSDEPLDVACFVDALQQGRVSVTTGPILDLQVRSEVDSTEPGGVLSAPGGGMTVIGRIRAAPWVPIHQVRVIVNGQTSAITDGTVLERDEDGVLDATLTWTVKPQVDGWVILEAGWPLDQAYPSDAAVSLGDYRWVAPEHLPLAFTNPVRFDVDDDGAWTPPGLPEQGHPVPSE